ncbi:MAG: hypothetical protein M1831_004440 [Alyxoria varia]|nr:MAG: hypothetical protein M1831_004440 [Alyxoria varia]
MDAEDSLDNGGSLAAVPDQGSGAEQRRSQSQGLVGGQEGESRSTGASTEPPADASVIKPATPNEQGSTAEGASNVNDMVNESRPPVEDEPEAAEDDDILMDDAEKRENGEGSPAKENGEDADMLDGEGEGQSAQTRANVESSARSNLATQNHKIILPSYSKWFDMHRINKIEENALPEFFNGRNRSKTPAVYKDYRDFMINTYRLNPTEYLTFTACRRNLAGDVCAIMRVHACLEQWGLINYQIDPETRPSSIGPPFTGHFRLYVDTPRGLQQFQPAVNATVTEGKPHAGTQQRLNQGIPSSSDLNLPGRRNIYEPSGKDVTPATTGEDGEAGAKSLEDGLKAPKEPIACYTCKVDCTRDHWHNSKSHPESTSGTLAAQRKYNICNTCYLGARFPGTMTSQDFTKQEYPDYESLEDKDKPWSDRETLLLLEGLEEFDDNWDEVAKHVGTRSREQCILKFLQLEVEDQYVAAETTEEGQKASTGDPWYLRGGRVPFTQGENPVMSVLGFLAAGVDPSVAAAASGQAVDAMVKSMSEKHRTLKQRFEALDEDKSEPQSEPAHEESQAADQEAQPETKTEDRMDLDTTNAAKDRQSAHNPATTSLALAGARSASMASHQERRISSLLSTATSLQLEKLNLKLQQFSELESLVAAEKRDLERRGRELFLERLSFRRRCDEVREGVLKGVRAGLDKEDGEGMKTVIESLKSLGIKGERLELKVQPKSTEDKGPDQEGSGENLEQNGDAAQGDGVAGTGMDIDLRPLGPDDPGYKSIEI